MTDKDNLRSEQQAKNRAALDKHLIDLKAVRLDLLDEQAQPIVVRGDMGSPAGVAVASGFLMMQPSGLYLYTCWHVVTGIDLHHAVLPGARAGKRCMRLRLTLQAHTEHPSDGSGVELVTIGGAMQIDLPLYDTATSPPTPLWEQDTQSQPNSALSMAGLAQPFWHDAVRIRLPTDLKAPDVQYVASDSLWTDVIAPGDSLLLVGYPYGYSTLAEQPTPIVLRRSIAAIAMQGTRRREVLLDGAGAPGMSGGPVFIEKDGRLNLFGMYTGVIFPDSPGRERSTALGSVCRLDLLHVVTFGPATSNVQASDS